MKKTLVIAILLLMISTLMLSAFAADDYEAKLDIKYEVNSDGNIVVTASLNNIKVKNGICVCEYDIFYNDRDLKLVKPTVNIPNKWKSEYDKGNVEDFSHKNNNGLYCWAIFSATEMIGITEDDQLYIVLEFEPLTEKSTEIRFVPVDVGTDVVTEVNGMLMYDIGSISINAAKISIDLKNIEEPNIDDDVSVPDNDLIPPHTSIDEFVSGSSDSIGAPNNSGAIGLPNINQSGIEPKPEDNNVLWIVIIIIVVLVCAGATVYVVIVSRSKGDKND